MNYKITTAQGKVIKIYNVTQFEVEDGVLTLKNEGEFLVGLFNQTLGPWQVCENFDREVDIKWAVSALRGIIDEVQGFTAYEHEYKVRDFITYERERIYKVIEVLARPTNHKDQDHIPLETISRTVRMLRSISADWRYSRPYKFRKRIDEVIEMLVEFENLTQKQ